jgi:TPR repeat protein
MPLTFIVRNNRRAMRSFRAFLMTEALLLSAVLGHAEDVDELPAKMAKAPEGCHPDYRPHNYVDYSECDSISDETLGAKCAKEVARKNGIIWRWNSFVRTCRSSESGNGNSISANPVPPADSKPPSLRSKAEPDSEEVVELFQRARKLAETGDIAAARLVLQRAVEAHSAQAALALGGMYDPTVLQQLHIHGVMPDIAEARRWYEKATEYGSAEAPRRLQALVGHGP